MPFLELNSVTKRFGGLKAVDDFSLAIEEGTLTAIIGPNGCGKSTLFNLISGSFLQTEGDIFFKGNNITKLQAEEIALMGMGRKFQVPAVFSELTVEENLKIPTLAKRNVSSLGLNEILDLIRLQNERNTPADSLSHGERQWLEIGMILAQSPDLILLDEPTAGMSITETASTAQLIKQINREAGITVLVIEHDIGFIEQLDCPLSVMSRGKLLRQGTFQSIRADKEVQALYFGTEGAEHA